MKIEAAFKKCQDAQAALNKARNEFWENGGFDGADWGNMNAASEAIESAWVDYLEALRSADRGRGLTAEEKVHNYYGMCELAV